MHETVLTWEEWGRPRCLFWVTVGGGNTSEEVATGTPETDQTGTWGESRHEISQVQENFQEEVKGENSLVFISLSGNYIWICLGRLFRAHF